MQFGAKLAFYTTLVSFSFVRSLVRSFSSSFFPSCCFLAHCEFAFAFALDRNASVCVSDVLVRWLVCGAAAGGSLVRAFPRRRRHTHTHTHIWTDGTGGKPGAGTRTDARTLTRRSSSFPGMGGEWRAPARGLRSAPRAHSRPPGRRARSLSPSLLILRRRRPALFA